MNVWKPPIPITQVYINKLFEGKIVNISLPISFNICCGCLKEPSHQDGSFEYPQHMFWLRNKKKYFWNALLTKVMHYIMVGITYMYIQHYRTLVKTALQKFIFLFLNQNICCGYSKEPSQ